MININNIIIKLLVYITGVSTYCDAPPLNGISNAPSLDFAVSESPILI